MAGGGGELGVLLGSERSLDWVARFPWSEVLGGWAVVDNALDEMVEERSLKETAMFS